MYFIIRSDLAKSQVLVHDEDIEFYLILHWYR